MTDPSALETAARALLEAVEYIDQHQMLVGSTTRAEARVLRAALDAEPAPRGVTLSEGLSRLPESDRQKVYDIIGPCDGVPDWNVPTALDAEPVGNDLSARYTRLQARYDELAESAQALARRVLAKLPTDGGA